MFVITNKKTFTAPVEAHVPIDGGRTQKAKFTVVFKVLSKQEVEALLDAAGKNATANKKAIEAGEGRTVSSDRELVDEVLVGFGDDLREEDNTPMAFTPANVDRLCSIWPMESALAKSFIEHYISAPSKN